MSFRVDKTGVVHASVAKASFDQAQILENIRAFMSTIVAAKPQSSKGRYVKSVTISSTMGPGITVDSSKIAEAEEVAA